MSYVDMGYEESKKIDFNIFERVPLALGMLVRSLLIDPDTQVNDPAINLAVNSLTRSLMEKTLQYREEKLYSHDDLVKALYENIAYRLNVIEAFKMIGDVNAIIDALGFIFHTKPMLEEIAVLISTAEALGWIGAAPFYKEYYSKDKATGGSIGGPSFNTKLATGVLNGVVYQREMFREVRETARKALKLIESPTQEASTS